MKGALQSVLLQKKINSHPKIVKLLLDYGADTTIKDAKGKVPHISHVLEILESQSQQKKTNASK